MPKDTTSITLDTDEAIACLNVLYADAKLNRWDISDARRGALSELRRQLGDAAPPRELLMPKGIRIVIVADQDNPQERGELLDDVFDGDAEVGRGIVVCIDRDMRPEGDYDGLRQVTPDQIRVL